MSEDPEEAVEIFAYTTYLEGQTIYGNNDIISMKATSEPDTLYYYEAMKEPDAAKFEEAMGEEWEHPNDVEVRSPWGSKDSSIWVFSMSTHTDTVILL